VVATTTNTGLPAAPGSACTPQALERGQGEILVWRKSTWGSYGQHDNLYTFVIDLKSLETKAIFELVQTRHENKDSSKNIHRYTYVNVSELRRLEGCVLKFVHDYASARKREINVEYALVINGSLRPLECTRSLRDAQGFFDEVKLSDGRKLIIRKTGVSIQ
jgi:hypothetical protein